MFALVAACTTVGAPESQVTLADTNDLPVVENSNVVADNANVAVSGIAAPVGIFPYSALSLSYCLPDDGAGRSVQRASGLSPSTPGAYACALTLTLSDVPLCGDVTPSAPFRMLTVYVNGVAPGSYTVVDQRTLLTANDAVARLDTFGDPSACTAEGRAALGGFCAPSVGGSIQLAGAEVAIKSFAAGGSSDGSALLTGSFANLNLPEIASISAAQTRAGVALPSWPAQGPLSGVFTASSCSIKLR